MLDFKHPMEMKKLMDFSLPEEPLNIDTLLDDCRIALHHQVKTG